MTPADDPESVPVVTERLVAFLGARLPGATDVQVSGLRRSGTGSSRENWPFDGSWRTTDGELVQRELLLRRDPQSAVVDTGRATEFGLLQALEASTMPAPKAHWLDDSGAELLRPSMIIDRHEGQAHRAVLRDKNPLRLSEQDRGDIARRLCELLAEVHHVDVRENRLTETLPDPGANPAEHELAVWERNLSAAELEPQPALRWTLRWLRDHLPAPPPRQVLVHGDFRPANVLIRDRRIEVLLDWEMARLGDPLDDLGWYCNPLYTAEHFIPGTWEQHDFLRMYTELTGHDVDPEALRFWQTLAVFRLSVIALLGIRGFCVDGSDRPAAPADGLVKRAMAPLATSMTNV